MRNIRKRKAIILIIASLALVLAVGAYIAIPKGITQLDLVTGEGEIVSETLEMYVGTETQLSCKIKPASFVQRKVEYAVADETVATVDENGLISALKEGDTRLTVSCAGFRKNYTFKAEPAVEDITGLDKEITLYEGDEFQLEPKIKMADKDLDKPAITYKTKRNTIATVDNSGLITAVSEGETTITVSAGDVTKKVKVIVEEAPEETTTPVTTTTDGDNDNNNKATKKKTKKKTTDNASTNTNTSNNTGGGSSSSESGGSSGSGSGNGDSSGDNSGSDRDNGDGSDSSGSDSGSNGKEG